MKRKSLYADIIKKIFLFVFSFLIIFLITEVAVRFIFPRWAPRTALITKFWRYDSKYGWSHIPNSKGHFKSYGFDTWIEINSYGFRGREIPYERDGLHCRILVMGDSFVWGYGVEQNEIFTSLMEEMNPRLEVINFGVSGYSTDQELLLLRDKGTKYQPDIVLLVVSANDFKDNLRKRVSAIYNKPMFKVMDNNKLVLINNPVPKYTLITKLISSIAMRSYILNQAYRIYERSNIILGRKPKIKNSPSIQSKVRGKYPSIRVKLMALLISEFQETCSEIRAKLFVIFDEGVGRAGHELEDYLENSEIYFIHLDKILDVKDKTVHLEKDFHWNNKGHYIVAQTILEELNQ